MNVRTENSFLQAVARRLARDHMQADDLVQEAWLVVLRRGVDDIEKPRPWLAGVLRNLAFRASRSQRRRSRYEESAPPADLRCSTAPDDRAALEETKRCVTSALSSLPAHYGEVVRLRYFENLTSQQIAQRLDISASAVRTRLQRALALLRTKLDATWHGDARSLAVGLVGLAALAEPRTWLPRAGAAAAMLLASVAWMTTLAHDTTAPPAPSIATQSSLPAAARTLLNEAVVSPVSKAAPAAPAHRLVATVRFELQGDGKGSHDLAGSARVTFTADPHGKQIVHECRLDAACALDLTVLATPRWPKALWVSAQHPLAVRAQRFAVRRNDSDTTILSIEIKLQADVERHRRPGQNRTHPRPDAGSEGPLTLRASRSQAREPAARTGVRRRGSSATRSGSQAAQSTKGAGAIPILRHRITETIDLADDAQRDGRQAPDVVSPTPEPRVFGSVEDRSPAPPLGPPPPGPPPLGLAAPRPPSPRPPSPRSMPPEGPSLAGGASLAGVQVGATDSTTGGGIDFRITLMGLPQTGSAVVNITGDLTGIRRLLIGDDRGPAHEVPDAWRRGATVVLRDLYPGRYRLFAIDEQFGLRPTQAFEIVSRVHADVQVALASVTLPLPATFDRTHRCSDYTDRGSGPPR